MIDYNELINVIKHIERQAHQPEPGHRVLPDPIVRLQFVLAYAMVDIARSFNAILTEQIEQRKDKP